MTPRLLADENTSRLVSACIRIDSTFPLVHISEWQNGACLALNDTALLMTLRDQEMILVGFDRTTIPMHAGALTRQGVGHTGVILFRRSVSTIAYGQQARLLVNLWSEGRNWDWSDRIEYLPGRRL